MKTFADVSRDLYEAKFKLPRGHEEVKRDSVKAAGKKVDIVYSEYRGKVHVFLNGDSLGEPWKNLKVAEKEMKDVKKVMKQMSEEDDIDLEEIANAVNNRI